jgi:hypothetical protein
MQVKAIRRRRRQDDDDDNQSGRRYCTVGPEDDDTHSSLPCNFILPDEVVTKQQLGEFLILGVVEVDGRQRSNAGKGAFCFFLAERHSQQHRRCAKNVSPPHTVQTNAGKIVEAVSDQLSPRPWRRLRPLPAIEEDEDANNYVAKAVLNHESAVHTLVS